MSTQKAIILARLVAGERAIDIAANLGRKPSYIRQVAYKARNPILRSSVRRDRNSGAPLIGRKRALALGLPAYYTGRPCARGHLAPRATANSTCSACANQAKNSARNKDADKSRRKRRAYYWAHVNAERASIRRSYAKFRSTRTAQKVEWQRKNKDKVKARSRRWLLRHPDVANARSARRRAGIGRATPLWLTSADHEIMRTLYARARRDGSDVDHIIPLNGKLVSGLHVPWNLQLLTPTDNRSKSNRSAP